MKVLRAMSLLTVAAGLVACNTPSPHAIQFAQERHACAELGIVPGTDAFSGCVADLDATMFADAHPFD